MLLLERVPNCSKKELQEALPAVLPHCMGSMDLGDTWKLDETNWLTHNGIFYFASDRGDNEISEGAPAPFRLDQLVEDPLCNFHPPNFIGISEVEMRGSEDVAAGTVLQRLIQEQLRYGNPNENMNLLAIQHQATGSAGPSNSTTSTLSSTENLAQEDPQMVQQSARQEPQGQEHQVDNTVMEKQSRATQPHQNNEELPTYEEAKAQSQFFRGQQPGAVGPSFYIAGVSSQKSRTEGRPTVNRANSGQAHKDEALKELKQGHVRSLSERIMQLSLERNGAKQHPPTSGSNKGFKAGGPPPTQPSGKGTDPRGPPPEYPYKAKQVVSPASKTQEHGLFYNDQQSGMMQEILKPSYPAPLPARPEAAVVRYQPPPEYGVTSRQCPSAFPSVPVQQHSPMSSQASSVSGPLHSASLPLLPSAVPAQPPPATPPSQQLTPDAYAIVERAQQMVEMLSEENHVLRQELEGYYEKADKLQKELHQIQEGGEAISSPVIVDSNLDTPVVTRPEVTTEEEKEDQGQEEEEVDDVATVTLSLELVPVSLDVSQAASESGEGSSVGTEGRAMPPDPATRAWGTRKCARVHEDLMRQHVSVLCKMQQTLVQKNWEDTPGTSSCSSAIAHLPS